MAGMYMHPVIPIAMYIRSYVSSYEPYHRIDIAIYVTS